MPSSTLATIPAHSAPHLNPKTSPSLRDNESRQTALDVCGAIIENSNVRPDAELDLQDFRLEKEIGKGQFSKVYKARSIKDKSFVIALKVMKLDERLHEKAQQDCIKEIDLLKGLNHRNIIHLYHGVQTVAKELVLMLELADAGDLQRLIQHYRSQPGRKMAERTVWKYFLQIADAIAYMHEKRIMHRDIKPGNVFITRQGDIKVGDLGLGRMFSQKTFAANSLVGTPYYMSPERIHEQSYDFKSDIWSLGCLLYEMGALYSPFYGDKTTLYTLCQKIDNCDYSMTPLMGYSKEMRNLVASMIQNKARLRPEASTVFAEAKENYRIHRAAAKEDASPAA